MQKKITLNVITIMILLFTYCSTAFGAIVFQPVDFGSSVEGISLSRSSATIYYGNTLSLKATLSPSGATGTVSWKSNNSSVATVSGGTVTAKGVGSATITASCSGKSATCIVTVKKCDSSSMGHSSKYEYKFDKVNDEKHDATVKCPVCNTSWTNKGITHVFLNNVCPCGAEKGERKDRSISLPSSSQNTANSTHNTVKYFTYDGTDVTATAKSSDSSIVSVSISDGNQGGTITLTPKKAGTATVTVTVPASATYKAATAKCTVTVTECDHPGYVPSHTCPICNSKYNDGKSVNGVSYDTHIYVGERCKICNDTFKVLSNEFSSKMVSWSSYAPRDAGNITFTGRTVKVTVDGIFESPPVAIASYSHYTPQSEAWHNSVREELNSASYPAHLERKDKVGGGGTITGTFSGNTITFTGFPTSGGPYKVNYTIGGNGAARRYTTPGSTTTETYESYTVTTQHLDISTGEQLLTSETNTVSKGGSITKSKKTINGYTYEKVVGPDGTTSYNTSLTLNNINSNKVIKFYYSSSSTPDEEIYTVTTQHLDLNTGNQILSSEMDYVYEGGNITKSKKTISGYTYEKVIGPDGTTSYNTSLTLNNIKSDKVIKFYYINIESQVKQMYTVTTSHLDLNSGMALANYEYNSVNEGESITKGKKNISGYTYVKVENSDGITAYGETMTLSNVTGDKEIRFYYIKNSVNVFIEYREEETQTEIRQSEVKTVNRGSSLNVSKVDITGYKFVSERHPNGTITKTGSVYISNVNDSVTIVFYYKKLLSVTVKHVNMVTAQPLENICSSWITYVDVGETISEKAFSEANLKMTGKNYKFANEYTIKTAVDSIEGTESSVERVAQYDTEITFYYTQSGKIKVYGRAYKSPEYPILYGPTIFEYEFNKNNNGMITEEFTALPKAGFEYMGYTIENADVSNFTEKTVVNASNLIATIDQNNTVKTITFLYKFDSGMNYAIEHKDKAKDINMEGTVKKTGDLVDLLAASVDLGMNNSVLNEYSNIMSQTEMSTNEKAARIFQLINTNKKYTIPELISLNLQDTRYEDYKFIGYEIEESEFKKNITDGTRYTLDLNEVANVLRNNGITGNSVDLVFNYSKEMLTIKHVYRDKNKNVVSQEEEYMFLDKVVDNKWTVSNKLKDDYSNDGVKLNGVVLEQYNPKNVKLKSNFNVEVNTTGEDQEIVIYYTYQPDPATYDEPIPEFLPKPTPPPDATYFPVTCTPSIDKNITYVDSKIVVTIPNKGVHPEFSNEVEYYNSTYAYQKLIKFPFDVYFDGVLYDANNWIEIANRAKIYSEGKNDGKYTFVVPAWVEDNKEYDIEIYVTSENLTISESNITGVINANPEYNLIYNNGNVATGRIKLKVIGKIYDFSVTNLENDTVWKNALFKIEGQEYKASTLPIGQKGFVMDAYKYGMKLGSPFLFSVNTLGINNKKLKIDPKVYFVDVNGENMEEVTAKLEYKTTAGNVVLVEDTSVILATKINKDTRTSLEVRNEIKTLMDLRVLAASETTFFKTLFTIGYNYNTNMDNEFGHYKGLSITTNLRLPFAKYLDERDSSLMPADSNNKLKILSAANHWYGEYKLPATTEYLKSDGFYIVCFKVTSLDESGNTHLMYENQLLIGNQWKNENETNGEVTIKLPNVAGQTKEAITKVNIESNGGYYPVAVYQANISVNNDYEIAGTH